MPLLCVTSVPAANSYTEWVLWDGIKLAPMWDHLVGRELYDHQGDDGRDFDAYENVNVADQHQDLVQQLSAMLHTAVASQ